MSGHPTIIRVMILLLLMIGWLGAGFYLGQQHANDCMRWSPGPASDARSGEGSTAQSAYPLQWCYKICDQPEVCHPTKLY